MKRVLLKALILASILVINGISRADPVPSRSECYGVRQHLDSEDLTQCPSANPADCAAFRVTLTRERGLDPETSQEYSYCKMEASSDFGAENAFFPRFRGVEQSSIDLGPATITAEASNFSYDILEADDFTTVPTLIK